MSMKTAKAFLCATIVTYSSTSAHAESSYDSYGLAGISVTSAGAHEDERAGFALFAPIAAGAIALGSLVAYAINAKSGGSVNRVMQQPPHHSVVPLPNLLGVAAGTIANHARHAAANPHGAPSRANQILTHTANGLGIVASGVSAAQGSYAAVEQFGTPGGDWRETEGNAARATGSTLALLAYPESPQAATVFNMAGNGAKAAITRDPYDAGCAAVGCALSATNMFNRQRGHGGKLFVGQVASSCWSAFCSYMGHDMDR
jgi:hypothetical protein